jgi:NitT/TauT family transport system substrate-binding protein
MALVCLVTLVLFSMAGCSKKTETGSVSSTGTGQKAKTLKPFEIAMSPVSYNRSLSPISVEEGYFKEGGLDVQFIPLEASSDQFAAVQSGKLKLTNSGSSKYLLMIGQNPDLDIVYIGGSMSAGAFIMAKPGDTERWQLLVDLANASTGPSQYSLAVTQLLTGKKVGMIRGSSQEIGFMGGLYEHGVDVTKFELVAFDTQPTSIAALQKGEIDLAVIGTPYRLAGLNQGLSPILHVDELAPYLNCCRITTTRKNIKEHREDYVNFLKSHIKAYKILQTEHEKSIGYDLKHFTLDRETLQAELYDIGHLSLNPDPNSKAVHDEYNRINACGIGNLTFDLGNYFDLTIYEDALNSVIAENPGDQFFLDMKEFFQKNNIYIGKK